MDALKRAIEAAGGPTALAKSLGISRQAIYKWHKAKIPAERIADIERATGGAVRRQELRPDIFRA